MMRLRLILAAMVATAGVAPTQDAALKELFSRYDADKSGGVSRAEFPGSNEQFAAMDRDRSGEVSLEEYANSAVARRFLAARRRNTLAPRDRVNLDQQRAARLAQLARFDRDGDGRIRADQWTGPPTAFASLDLDRNGVLDSADRRLAERAAKDDKIGTYDDLPQFTTYLPSVEDIFKRRDKNRDQLLSRKEAAPSRFLELFEIADTNLDERLDMDEVTAMVRAVAVRVRAHDRPYVKPRAYEVPFSTWDKNKDGRIDTGEWVSAQYLFPRFDINRDGAVTKDEVRRYKISVEGDGFVEKFDLDRDGKVTPREFAGPADVFRRADRNGDGAVTSSDR